MLLSQWLFIWIILSQCQLIDIRSNVILSNLDNFLAEISYLFAGTLLNMKPASLYMEKE